MAFETEHPAPGAPPRGDIEADVCVIGAGSGGLSTAYGTSQLGRKTVLIEGAQMGGDCLNFGCVPSKALLAAGKAAQHAREAGRFGVTLAEPEVDFAKVHEHVRGVIETIAPNDSVERYEGLGVTVIRAWARFTGPDTLVAGDTTVRAKHFVLATGSRPSVPAIEGLDQVPYLTNEILFDLTERPRHLIIIGGGPIGLEMAQAHRRLGSDVTVVEGGAILGKDDPELVAEVRKAVSQDGVRIEEDAKVVLVEKNGNGGLTLRAERDGRTFEVAGSHLLVAVGREPNIEKLGLEAAGVETDENGVKVDEYLRTTNRRVWAVGDVAGGLKFTHVAGYHAGLVVRNMLFKVSKAKNEAAAKAPHVTYTDPELAQIGLTEAEAKKIDHKVARFAYHENDRAIAERTPQGFAKVIVGKGGKVLGAGIVGKNAGELIGLWALAVSSELKLTAITSMIAPYPTLTEVSKRAASAYYTDTLFSDRTKKVVSALSVLDGVL
ncbi:dihydrolipoyl dehydrogenase family protein [Parvularcula dongshanensis]|uniref:Pyruvate/2-oxoglutarate dehydrogenase complex dihydrolipoamide dehydrogenase (E3) component n=1 Tax=Parvularcula dongshanensis TaxID=1173995 RepID=A0A840I056_9PROT|nr:FAD-dependent oxidoreductase [Parvularcula dongshanensis]MBB4657548.1 pyruvate/2-oxoglutarate dehydrogenase complex dihydrolipoamide dehydrogenase (E3) component [Parvularcula dongshanensis]